MRSFFFHFLPTFSFLLAQNVSFLYSLGSLVSLHPFNVSIEQRTHRNLTKKGGKEGVEDFLLVKDLSALRLPSGAENLNFGAKIQIPLEKQID